MRPGAAAREVAARVGPAGHVLVVDRSPRGVALVERTCAEEIAAGTLSVRCVAAEDFTLEPGEAPYDLCFAVRVGALDGRHPKAGARAGPHPRRAHPCRPVVRRRGATRCERSGSPTPSS